ncbi:MAG: sigma-70 family RNA polymerase sigma factor [Bacteroides sp.]|nr:sigma-70 family RNA polymerase sigma factor [Bacteroides sp.]
MATTPNPNHAAIEDYYRHSDKLRRYVGSRINNEDDAADLVQEVFLRLLEYSGRIVTATVANLAFTIASRVINDYLRHHYVKTSAHHEISNIQVNTSNDTEETVIGRDMARLERHQLEAMPPQRRLIYIMRIHQGKSTKEISKSLNISPRTAENHFYIGIRQMRACFSAAI